MPTKDRQELLKSIRDALTALGSSIHIDNAAGLTGLNSIAEDILAPVLSLLLDAPELQSTNTLAANAKTVDLYCPASTIGIQVTSETTSSKVTGTLMGYASAPDPRLIRLVFVVLSPTKKSYDKDTKAKWVTLAPHHLGFKPERDVIGGVPDLFARIKTAPEEKLRAIERSLAQSVFGREAIDLDRLLERQVRTHIGYEERSQKYIPEVFVETPDAKNLARAFAHPALFFGRIVDRLRRYSPFGYSKSLVQAGFPPLDLPNPNDYRTDGSLSDTVVQARRLRDKLRKLRKDLDRIYQMPEEAPTSVTPSEKKFYEARYYDLKNSAYYLQRPTEELIESLDCVLSKVLVFTSPAGQGKTMFTCDLVSKCLQAHGIPCAFLTGSFVSQHVDLPVWDVVTKDIFQEGTIGFQRGLEMLSKHAATRNRPFVIVIDGLNEHRNTTEFSKTLHRMIVDTLPFESVKFLFTCRTEFFDRRFGGLVQPPVSGLAHQCTHLDYYMFKRSKTRMVQRHFEYFDVDGDRIADKVWDILEQDRILLRLFSEVYGRRNGGERPLRLDSIYRLEIFQKYFEQRIRAAAAYRDVVTGKPLENALSRLKRVLRSILGWMVEERKFVEVPLDRLSDDLRDVAEYLLAEEIIIRRDLPAEGVFGEDKEAASFTFDELRDFLLADYLANQVFPNDPAGFIEFIRFITTEARPVAEGVRRFLFHLARTSNSPALYAACDEIGFFDEVFAEEIFNVDRTLVTEEDKVKVVEVLKKRNWVSQGVAMQLLRRWRVDYFPHLNLDVVVDLEYQEGGKDVKSLIAECFEGRGRRRYNLEETCDVLQSLIKDSLGPTRAQTPASSVAVLRLLLTIIDLEAGIDMESPASRALRPLLEGRHKLASDLIEEAIRSKLAAIQPFLWRLAAELMPQGSESDRLVGVAREVVKEATCVARGPANPTRREARRFLRSVGIGLEGIE